MMARDEADRAKDGDLPQDPFEGTEPVSEDASSGASGTFGTPLNGHPQHFGEPQPLPDELPPVEPLELELMPSSLRPWIRDIAERMQCPPDFLGASAMVALAGVVGRKVGICPRRQDDWLVVPNLWGAVIGRPGVLKSPAVKEVLRPIQQMEELARQEHQEALKDYTVKQIVAEQSKRVAKEKIQAALKKGEDAEAVARQSIEGMADEPIRRRRLANDSTVEKLGELLNQNPNGLLVFRDELIGLIKSLDKDGQEGARAFYLEAWNGDSRFTWDRIGRGTIDIPYCTLSVLGGIQPGPLSTYLRAALSSSQGDDGFIQRFQLIVWPDISAPWTNVDRAPDSEARARAYQVFERLDALDPATIGAEAPADLPGAIPFLRFAESAQVLFDEWRERLELLLRSGELHPALESHFAKYRSLIPSLALLIHLAEGGTGTVTRSALEKALSWDQYLRSHARRLYAVQVAPEVAGARALAKLIQRGKLTSGFTVRDLYRTHRRGLDTKEAAERATGLLEDLNWLRSTEPDTGGRRTRLFWISPKIPPTPKGGSAKSVKSQGGGPSVTFGAPGEGSSSGMGAQS